MAAALARSGSGLEGEVELPQAIVYLIRQDDTLVSRNGEVVFAFTDSMGRFTFDDVPAEPLLVAAVLPGNRRLAGLIRPREGENRIEIGLATTCVAAYLRDRVRALKLSLSSLPLERLAELAARSQTHLGSAPLASPDLTIDASPRLARRYGVVVAARDAALARAWAEMLGRPTPAIETLATPSMPGSEVRSVAVAPGPRGSIYFGETSDLVARLSVRGPGPGDEVATLLTGSRQTLQLGLPAALGFEPGGRLFLGDGFSGYIRRFDPLSVRNPDIDRVPIETEWITEPGEIPVIPSKIFRDAHPAALDISPRSCDFAPDGTVFVADARNHRVLAISPDGKARRVAGLPPSPAYDSNALAGFSGDGGPATAAALAAPNGVAWRAEGASGSLYIADTDNHRIRRVDLASGIITTVAGSGPAFSRSSPDPGAFSGDGGPATAARLKYPFDVLFLEDGTMLVADSGNQRVRAVGTDGIIRTWAGGDPGEPGATADDGPADETVLGEIYDMALDGAGNVLLAARDKGLRKLWLRAVQ